MEKMIQRMKMYKGEIILFFCVITYLFLTEGFGCKIFTRFDFDSQAFLFWQYAAIEKQLPYKDIFYPYGLFFYFKDTNFFFQILFYAIPALLCSLLYFLLKKIYSSRLLALFMIGVFCIFILRFIGLETVGRYGVAAIYALLFAWLFSQQVLVRPRLVAAIGISIGLVFSLLHDQGMYAVVLFFFFLLASPFLHQQYRNVQQTLFRIVFSSLLFMSFFLIGLLPFFGYLVFHSSVSPFISAFLQNSDIALFAKTPFPPFAASVENIFTFLILFISIGMLLVKRWFYKEKYELLDFLQLSIVVLIVLLEQKSLIRSIANQITFLSLLLYFFLYMYILKFFKKEKIFLFYPVLVAMVIGFMVLISLLRPFQKGYKTAGTFDATYCVTENTRYMLKKHPQQQHVLNFVHANSSKDTHVFSYPGDPLWYVLFDQSVPYYPSSYEATPVHAQKKQITFLKNKEVKYVIYNTDIHSIQDGVPDYVRTPEISAYIFTHFSPIKQIGSFLLFKRSENHDMFGDKNVLLPAKFAQFLLDVHLENIPKSEGLYKRKYIVPSEIIEKDDGVPLHSKNLFLLVHASDKNEVMLRFVTDISLQSTVTMKDCRKGCIVDVSKLPLFYTPRIIKSIDTVSREVTSLQFFKTTNSVFW